MIRSLIVHKSRLMGEMLSVVLEDDPDVQVLGFVQSAEAALSLLRDAECDVVVVSIDLPDNGALRLTNLLTQNGRCAKVLITGLVHSKTAILRCVEEGAAGYVLEEESPDALAKKVRAVCENRFMVSPEVATALIERVAELKKMAEKVYGAPQLGELFANLTPRELEVLALLEQGYSNREIAEELVIEVGTVKNHVHSILGKFDVETRQQAALMARQILKDRPATAQEPMEEAAGPRYTRTPQKPVLLHSDTR